jgi:hypothetical protein
MKASFQSHPTSDLLESEGFQTNASLSRWCVLPPISKQLPYLIRFATGGLGVVRGGDERI